MNIALQPVVTDVALPKLAPTELSDIGHLMLLDDAPFDHSAVRRAARQTGLVDDLSGFYMAEDALEFLARPGRPTVDLLLVDLYLPRMGGLEFLAEAKAQFGPGFARRIYLALTLAPDAELADEAEDLGIVDGWIEKPVTASALMALATQG